MTNRLKAVLVGAACLVCCIPLVLSVVGVSTGIGGAVALWFRRYDLVVLGALGLIVVSLVAFGRRSQDSRQEGGG